MSEMFNMYIRKAADLFGVTYTRQIYEKAIETLADEEAKEMCLRFADLERKLGEIDRARAVYGHCSQLCDPRTSPNFWAIWKEFEIKHGNEDTIREMLRIKRSVQATFNTQVNFMSAQISAVSDTPATDMKALERAVEEEEKEGQEEDDEEVVESIIPEASSGKSAITFVRSQLGGDATARAEGDGPSKTMNPDEIDIDEDEEEDEGDQERPAKRPRGDGGVRLELKQVPKEVFGGLRDDKDDDSD
jgi:pre-mRNA-splicing factor SYF1